MSNPLTRLQARIAGQLARERMGERFAAQVMYEAVPVAGPGLARVDGQLVASTVSEEQSVGSLVAMANVGRPAAAMYSPQGGAAVVMASSGGSSVTGGGVTVHAQLSGLGADDHQHYFNIERGDARYYTEPEVDAWRAAHIADPDIHHKHATVAAPLSIDGDQYISLLYNSTLLKDGSNKLGVNQGYNFAWTSSHSWAMNTTLSSAGVVISPGLSTGYGWSIVNPTSGDATLTIPNIYVGNLHAQVFIADTARVDVGEEIWTRSRAMLAQDYTVPALNASSCMAVEVPPGVDGSTLHLFGDNHFVRLRIFDSTQGLTIADAWGVVTFVSYTPRVAATETTAGQPARQTYTFQMLYGSAGAEVPAGALVMGYGVPGDAFVLVTVIKDGAPYTAYYRWGLNADGSVRATANPWEAQYWKLLTRIGNLEGQVDTAFGGALHGAGLYSENVYLKGKIQVAAGSDVPWSAVSGSGKPQDNATYGATWGVNLAPPGYLQAPGGGSAPGLYLEGARLGFWNGAWRTYLDDAGNFIFNGPGVEQTSIAEGTTRLAYLSTPGILGGQVYRSGLWRKTWWTDNATGAMYAGEDGEVLLHEYGLSLLAYSGSEIAPTYNTKAVGFFASGDQITNVNKARARIWGGYNMDPDAAGAATTVRSMLQLEVGIDGDGVIASNNRPNIQLMYVPEMAVAGESKQFQVNEFNRVQFNMVRDGLNPSQVVVIADQTTLVNKTMVDQLLPGSSVKTIGASNSKFEAVYAKTVYADSVIAPSFTGQNTVGCELRQDNYWMDASTYHTWGHNMAWTPAVNDGFYNPANPKRVTVDATGFYRISYSVQFAQYEHFNFVRIYAANGSSYYDTLHSQTTSSATSTAGDIYLQAGQYVELWCTPGNGWTNGNKARFSVVRTGTNGVPTTTSVWTAADAVFIRSNSASTTNLRIENSNAGARMNLSVEGEITSELGLYNGVNVAVLGQEWMAHKVAADPHPQYMLKAQVQQVYATQDALTAAIANGVGGGGGETYHNALTGLTDGDPHTQYVAVAFARTITAQHTFSPPSAGAAFVLGPNASGRLVTGLNADLVDGHHWDELALAPMEILTALLSVDGHDSLLDADLLDGFHSSAFARAGVIVGAGAGLIGGGTLSGDFSLAVGAGPGIEVGEDTVSLAASVAGAGLSFNAGVLAVGAGDGIAVGDDTVSLAVGVAGAGLAYNAGVLSIGQGFGLLVGADDIAVDTGINYTWTGSHTFQGTMTARHIFPELTDTYDLGSSIYWWRQQFVSQINAVVFAEQTVQLLGGWFMIPKDAGTLPAVASGDTQIDLGKAAVTGSFILIRAHDVDGNIRVEYMQVGALVSGTTYNVTRDLAGAHVTDPAWADGTPYAVLGVSGDGRIEFNAYDTPRISIIRQGATYNAQTEILRLGDLNGFPNSGITDQRWGIYIGNNTSYLKYYDGTLTIAGNGSGLTSISGGNITTGSITGDQLNLSSYLSINSNTFGSDGVQLQHNGGNPRAYIGNGSNRYFQFDGTTITWAAANASLDANGYLTATNATLSGAITATSGSITGTLTIGASGKIDAGDIDINSSGITAYAGTPGLEASSAYKFVDSGAAQVGVLQCNVGYSGSGTSIMLEAYTPDLNDVNLILQARTATVANQILVDEAKIRLQAAGVYVRQNSTDYTVWHSGNDGAGSGLAADTLDGIDSASFLRSDASDLYSGGLLQVAAPAGVDVTNTGQINALQVYQATAGTDALMSFHVAGDYAVHFGLSGDDNSLVVGGWSMGANKYKIWHSGNHGASSGLNADMVDGTHAASFALAAGQQFSGTITAPSIETQGTGGQVVLNGRNGGNAFVFYNTSSILRLWVNSDKYTWDINGNFGTTGTVTAAGYLATSNGNGYMQLGPQNTGWCHMTTDRAAFYFDHGVCVNGYLWSYNGDFTLGRGASGSMSSKITFYTWGTYVYAHLTIEDVFALTNFQAAQPNTPASGVKVYAYNNAGNLQLRVRFSNGVDRALQLAAS